MSPGAWLLLAALQAGPAPAPDAPPTPSAAPTPPSAPESEDPQLPATLRLEAGVKDPVFALLIGLLASDSYGSLTRARLEQALGAQAARSRLPYRRLRELRRLPSPAGIVVTLGFDAPLSVPVPYAILGYHPGQVDADAESVFREHRLAPLRLSGGGATPGLVLEDVHLFVLERGRLLVDIDWWLDALLGSGLDDTELAGLAVFRQGGRWLGAALGRNRGGENRSGLFDFAADRILFPIPVELRGVARELRPRLAEPLR